MFFLLIHLLLLLQHAQATDECTATDNSLPTVTLDGVTQTVSHPTFQQRSWSSKKDDSSQPDNKHYYVLDESKHVWYVPNFLNSTLTSELRDTCTEDRFVRSPIRGRTTQKQPSDVEIDSIRTSESCAMVPASTYLSNPKFLSMRDNRDDLDDRTRRIVREVDVTWEVSTTAAQLLGVSPTRVEPLQMVRYTTPDAEYGLHHDHGGYYKQNRDSRSWTVLVFLNDVKVGGHTHFPKLDLRVEPREGDALVWSNVREDGTVDPDMVHAGEPPGAKGITKYVLNVWVGEEEPSLEGSEWGARKE